MSNKVNLGYWLYKRNMNISELSSKSKVSRTTLSSIKNGDPASERTLRKIAEALEVTVPDLYIVA